MRAAIINLINSSLKLSDHSKSMQMATGYKKEFNYTQHSHLINKVNEKLDKVKTHSERDKEIFIKTVIDNYFNGSNIEESVKIASENLPIEKREEIREWLKKLLLAI